MISKPLFLMNESELLELAKKVSVVLNKPERVVETATAEPKERRIVVGYKGLAQALGVTPPTAKYRFETGALDGACKMVNGKLITDADKAVLAWAEYQRKKKGL